MTLDHTRIFVKVVQHGSFSKAADLIKVPKSTVSKAISRLEKVSGTKLLMRTTRSLTLTAAGRVFYEACLGPITAIEEALKLLQGKDSILTGSVRITAAEDLGSLIISPAIAALSTQYPDISFELDFTDDVIDLVKDGFDLAVRVGKVNESSFKVKRVGEITLVPVASPKYLKNLDAIKHPKDIQAHSCLSLNTQSVMHRWILRSAKGAVTIPIKTQISSNQMTSLLKMAVAGAGIALVPDFICQHEFNSGKLIRVLPDWNGPVLPVSIVSPLSSASSMRLKVTIDHLTMSLVKVL
ncbi:MAG: hypothetical protein A2622_00185 [Bdellovibrionales bacterium RIFCSPHIGHO2_01_FULL_40_29]|nr:MAG: hypothetical protein A2622_00185 [Bdellovibrionales bacterium RIFCSPHIGHO2_01_FULL_40_29]OFZ32545.1 MAG: hypothetical protein A3D17_04785 [Bdellovibrionales bacterium RIFCSPHIGHO2_02_FULL_40_15]